MKLNTKAFRYLAPEDWRVLTAVEQGSKNHEVVPTPLIIQLSGLRAGSSGANRSISTLAKADLIAKEQNMKYDGYRLTYGGLDYLALHSHTKSNSVIHLGSQMGVGKESDIYLVTSPNPDAAADLQHQHVQAILKLHRLGRTSFRSIRTNRSYQGNRGHCSWQHLSRLSAHKEYLAMQALYSAGLPVPRPIAWSRHAIVMSLVPGIPLRQVPLSAFGAVKDGRDERIARLYGDCMEMTLKLAELGLIHGDFNEFNILIENVPEDQDPLSENEEEEEEAENPITQPTTTQSPTTTPFPPKTTTTTPTGPPLTPHLIDFPQITSLSHPQAATFYDRDVNCIKRFFLKRYHFTSSDSGPTFDDATARLEAATATHPHKHRRLDVEIEAAGFSRRMARELGSYYDVAASTEETRDGAVAEGERGDEEDEEDGEEGNEGEGEDDSLADLVFRREADGEGAVSSLVTGEEVGSVNTENAGHTQNGEQTGGSPEQPPEILLSKLDLSSKRIGSTKQLRSQGTKAAAGWSI